MPYAFKLPEPCKYSLECANKDIEKFKECEKKHNNVKNICTIRHEIRRDQP